MEFMKVKYGFKFIVLKLYNFRQTVRSFDFDAYEMCAVNFCKKAWLVQNVEVDL
jgi:hypothetical protein